MPLDLLDYRRIVCFLNHVITTDDNIGSRDGGGGSPGYMSACDRGQIPPKSRGV